MPEQQDEGSDRRKKLYRMTVGLVLRAALGALVRHVINEVWK
jgi:hypothetical protein